MSKILKLKAKIVKIDELLEKEMAEVSLNVNLRNDVWQEFTAATHAVKAQKAVVEDVLKQHQLAQDFVSTNEKIDLHREIIQKYIKILNGRKAFRERHLVSERVEELARDLRVLEGKVEDLKKKKPVLMYIQESEKLAKLKAVQSVKEEFFDRAKNQAQTKSEKYRKLMLEKEKLQKALREEIYKESSKKERAL